MRMTAPVLLGVLGLSGCAGVDVPDIEDLNFWGDDSSRVAPLQSVVNRVALTPIWEHRVDSYEDVTSQILPYVDDESVFLTSPSGKVVALRVGTGQVVWESEVEGQVLAGVAADSAHVYVGTWERMVYALDRATGQIVWKQFMPSEVLMLASVSEDALAVRTNDGRISMLRSSDGELQWSHIHTSPALSLRGAGEPVVDGDRVISGFDDGRLISFDISDGRQHWDARLAMATGRNELERIVDVDGKVFLDDGVVDAAAQLSEVGAIEVTEGRVLWTQDIRVQNGPAIDEVAFYAVDTRGSVWAFNRRTGALYWRQGALAYRNLSSPAIAGLHAIVVDFEGYLHWLRVTDGAIVARHPLGSPLQAPPLVHLDRIYFLHQNGRFAVYQYVPLKSELDESADTDG